VAATTDKYRECQRRIRKVKVVSAAKAAEWALEHLCWTIDDLLAIAKDIPSGMSFAFWMQIQDDIQAVNKFIPRPRGAYEDDPEKPEADTGGPEGALSSSLSAFDPPSPPSK